MYTKLALLLTVALLLIVNLCSAQYAERPKIGTYDDSTIGLKDKRTLGPTTVTIGIENLSYPLRRGGDKQLAYSEVEYITLSESTNAKRGAAIGAGLGGGILLGALLSVALDETRVINSRRVVPVTLVLIGVPTLLGAFIGSQTARKKTYYFHQQ